MQQRACRYLFEALETLRHFPAVIGLSPYKQNSATPPSPAAQTTFGERTRPMITEFMIWLYGCTTINGSNTFGSRSVAVFTAYSPLASSPNPVSTFQIYSQDKAASSTHAQSSQPATRQAACAPTLFQKSPFSQNS
jgi:hypothetical protein